VVQVLKTDVGASLTNLAFGGPGRKTLYCTGSTSGSILCAPMEAADATVHTGAAPLRLDDQALS
jgi:gluconolactonase